MQILSTGHRIHGSQFRHCVAFVKNEINIKLTPVKPFMNLRSYGELLTNLCANLEKRLHENNICNKITAQ